MSDNSAAPTPEADTSPPKTGSGMQLSRWEPDDEDFWERFGKKIAMRNLVVSIPNLLCGFSVWL